MKMKVTIRSIFIIDGLDRLKKKSNLTDKDLVVVVAGNFGDTHGASFMEISTVKNLLQVSKQSLNLTE